MKARIRAHLHPRSLISVPASQDGHHYFALSINNPSTSHQMPDTFLFSAALILSGMVNLSMLPSFILRRNVAGTCTLLWLFLSNMLIGIDSVIPRNVFLQAPIYCDIGKRLTRKQSITLLTHSFCQWQRSSLVCRLQFPLECCVSQWIFITTSSFASLRTNLSARKGLGK